ECRICSARIAGRDLNKKTSALISLALRLGAVLSDADEQQVEQLSQFAEYLGQAYQISDDIVDVAEDGAATVTAHHVPEHSLFKAVERAKGVLSEGFRDCEARDRLLDVVDYVSSRSVNA